MYTTTHVITASYFPKDIRHYRNPYLPYPKQKPRLFTGEGSAA